MLCSRERSVRSDAAGAEDSGPQAHDCRPLGDSPLKVAAHAHRERQVRLFDAQARCGFVPADAASAWLYLYPQIVVARSNVAGYGANGLDSQFVVSGISKN